MSAETVPSTGDFLTTCGRGTTPEEILLRILERSEVLLDGFTEEFRAELTRLLQQDEHTGWKVVQNATLLRHNISVVGRSNVRSNINGTSEEEEQDPLFAVAEKEEIQAIQASYDEAKEAALKDRAAEIRSVVQAFTTIHMEAVANARAVVNFHSELVAQSLE
tara:strand:- start:441 stop:929 length:489 start_codon:yes stop_codon:yes gene_type:complete